MRKNHYVRRLLLVAGILALGPTGAMADDIPALTVPAPLSLSTTTVVSGSSPVSTSGSSANTTAKTTTAPAAAESSTSLLQKARTLIAASDFKGAIAPLKEAEKVSPGDADVQNLLGFTHRKVGMYPESLSYYNRALTIDPKHLNALEYRGELFVMTNKTASAKADLAKLKKLCGTKCEQYLDLSKAIAKKGKK
jgi:tetratricopeptide (TPR) repeat protein